MHLQNQQVQLYQQIKGGPAMPRHCQRYAMAMLFRVKVIVIVKVRAKINYDDDNRVFKISKQERLDNARRKNLGTQ